MAARYPLARGRCERWREGKLQAFDTLLDIQPLPQPLPPPEAEPEAQTGMGMGVELQAGNPMGTGMELQATSSKDLALVV